VTERGSPTCSREPRGALRLGARQDAGVDWPESGPPVSFRGSLRCGRSIRRGARHECIALRTRARHRRSDFAPRRMSSAGAEATGRPASRLRPRVRAPCAYRDDVGPSPRRRPSVASQNVAGASESELRVLRPRVAARGVPPSPAAFELSERLQREGEQFAGRSPWIISWLNAANMAAIGKKFQRRDRRVFEQVAEASGGSRSGCVYKLPTRCKNCLAVPAMRSHRQPARRRAERRLNPALDPPSAHGMPEAAR